MKFRLQLQGELQSKKAAPRMYRGVFHGVSVIFKNEGPKGLFRGIGAAVLFFLTAGHPDVDHPLSTYIR